MDHELQLISDGDGLAVLGAPADINLFRNSAPSLPCPPPFGPTDTEESR